MSYKYPVDIGDSDGPQLFPSGGETVFNRLWANSTVSLSNQNMRGVMFTARRTESISQVRTFVGSTAQVGATLARIGVWTVDASDNLTALVASTPNDTAMWSTPSVAATKSFSASWTKERGQRYCVALLIDGASQAPAIIDYGGPSAALLAVVPRRGLLLGSQTSLPSTVSVGSITNSTAVPYVELIP